MPVGATGSENELFDKTKNALFEVKFVVDCSLVNTYATRNRKWLFKANDESNYYDETE